MEKLVETVNYLKELGYKLEFDPEKAEDFFKTGRCVSAVKIDEVDAKIINSAIEEDTINRFIDSLVILAGYDCIDILRNSEDKDETKKEIEKLFNT